MCRFLELFLVLIYDAMMTHASDLVKLGALRVQLSLKLLLLPLCQHRTGSLVDCLRKLQNRCLSSVFEVYHPLQHHFIGTMDTVQKRDGTVALPRRHGTEAVNDIGLNDLTHIDFYPSARKLSCMVEHFPFVRIRRSITF
ncbi:hypothetical protein V6N12_014311 [Hibiscus sabdariffa]|uniref:Secreted protein n=1 Tax=Hibiscus sabdariffa TaxID=183260 RepID=A0ABR2DMN2_9ROSI